MSFYDDDGLLSQIPRLGADRKRCVVCGNKRGDCTSRDYGGPGHIVTLGQDEKLAEVDEVIIKEDIWEDREIAPGVWAKTLVARAGPMKKKKAMKLGII